MLQKCISEQWALRRLQKSRSFFQTLEDIVVFFASMRAQNDHATQRSTLLRNGGIKNYIEHQNVHIVNKKD